jgi:hypothetical protein
MVELPLSNLRDFAAVHESASGRYCCKKIFGICARTASLKPFGIHGLSVTLSIQAKSLIARIMAFAEGQDINRSEAIRMLLERGLSKRRK